MFFIWISANYRLTSLSLFYLDDNLQTQNNLEHNFPFIKMATAVENLTKIRSSWKCIRVIKIQTYNLVQREKNIGHNPNILSVYKHSTSNINKIYILKHSSFSTKLNIKIRHQKNKWKRATNKTKFIKCYVISSQPPISNRRKTFYFSWQYCDTFIVKFRTK